MTNGVKDGEVTGVTLMPKTQAPKLCNGSITNHVLVLDNISNSLTQKKSVRFAAADSSIVMGDGIIFAWKHGLDPHQVASLCSH